LLVPIAISKIFANLEFSMNSLFSILKKHIEETPVLKSASASLTVADGDKIITEMFGPEALAFMRAKYVRNDFLYIWCKSGVVASEIRLNETNILAKIREKFGSTKILGIKTIV